MSLKSTDETKSQQQNLKALKRLNQMLQSGEIKVNYVNVDINNPVALRSSQILECEYDPKRKKNRIYVDVDADLLILKRIRQ